MKRSLIALAIAGLASFSAHAQSLSAFSSGSERLGAQACARGQRSDSDAFGSYIPQRPLPYSCFNIIGVDDVFGFSDHPPQPTETDYNLWLAKYDGMLKDPRMVTVWKQHMALIEAQNSKMNKKAPWLASLDLFAEPGTKRNEELAKADVRRWKLSLGPTGATPKNEGPSEQCDSELFKAKLRLQQVDDIRRKAMMDSFEKTCQDKNKARQAAAADRAKEQAATEALLETPWQPEEVPAISRADAATVGAAIAAMADSGELASISIIVNPDKPTYTLVLDNSPKSKMLYLLLQPRVRQKELNLRIIPTSLFSEDANMAAEMLDKGGFAYLYHHFMSIPDGKKSSYTASAETLAKVRQNNEKLLASQLSGVPFRIRTNAGGTSSTPAFGLFTDKDFSFKDWPDRSWNPEQLKRINKETTLLIGRERSAQACPNQKADWTEEGGTVDGKETWKMTTKINFLTGCDYSKGGLPAGYSSGAQR